MDFSTGWACVSHASDVLGMCVMITSALLGTETERWREEQRLSSSGVFIGGFLGRLGMTMGVYFIGMHFMGVHFMDVRFMGCTSYGAHGRAP